MEGGREELLRNEIHQRTDRQMEGRERGNYSDGKSRMKRGRKTERHG